MADLHRLLAPRSIAVVGGAPAERVVGQCLKLGFAGPIWPVNPKRSELAGVACVPTLDALPAVPDAVFLGVNRHATVEAMATLRSIGAGGAVCYGSGLPSRARPICSAICSMRPAICRSSDRTATASSTPSIVSRCGPTSTAWRPRSRRRHRVAERQRCRQPHVPAARAAPRHDHLGRQPGQRRHGGLRRRVSR